MMAASTALGLYILILCISYLGKINCERAQYKNLSTSKLYKDFYFYNLTNHKEFAESNGKAMPVLEEIGPYSYREYRTKNFTDSSDPEHMKYTQQKVFFFDNTTSGPGLEETDIICTINIPLVGAISEATSLTIRASLRSVITFSKAKLYTCQEAGALAWNYTDQFVTLLYTAHMLPSKFVNLQVNNSINDSNPSIVDTGTKDTTKTGQFIQWDGLKRLHTWPNGDETGANDINGTEGFFFRPNLAAGEGLTVFIDDIQRSMNLEYRGHVKSVGVNGFQYGISNKTFASAFREPANARWGSWCPDGMIYLGPTQVKEIPVFGSKPHFLDGDPLLMKSVRGLSPPDRDKHDTVFNVNSTSGTSFNFARRLQINVQVNRTEKLPFYAFPMHETSEIVGYNGTGTLYFPVMYIDEVSLRFLVRN